MWPHSQVNPLRLAAIAFVTQGTRIVHTGRGIELSDDPLETWFVLDRHPGKLHEVLLAAPCASHGEVQRAWLWRLHRRHFARCGSPISRPVKPLTMASPLGICW